MSDANAKWLCTACGKISAAWEVLTAPSPFEPLDILSACPRCKDCEGLERVCEEAGCTEIVSCGTPHTNGYKFHCHLHPPGDAL